MSRGSLSAGVSRSVIASVVLSLLGARIARAADGPPALAWPAQEPAKPLVGPAAGAPFPASLPVENGLAAGQIALGTLTMVAAVGAAALLATKVDVGMGDVLLLASPVAPALTVCFLGQTSHYYDGGCGAPIGGAYIGAAGLGVPLLVLAFVAPVRDSDGGSEPSAQLGAAALVGFVVGAAIGAAVGWHLAKYRRDQATKKVTVPPRPRPPENSFDISASRWPRGPIRAATATFSVPLLVLPF